MKWSDGLTADDKWAFYKNILPRHLAIRPFTNLLLEMQTPQASSFSWFSLVWIHGKPKPTTLQTSSTTLTSWTAICIPFANASASHTILISSVLSGNLPTWLSGLLNECASNCFKKLVFRRSCLPAGKKTRPQVGQLRIASSLQVQCQLFWVLENCFNQLKVLEKSSVDFHPKDRIFCVFFRWAQIWASQLKKHAKKQFATCNPTTPNKKRRKQNSGIGRIPISMSKSYIHIYIV